MRSVIPGTLALADVTDHSRMTQSHPTAPFKAAYEPLGDSKKPCREETLFSVTLMPWTTL